MLEGEELIKEEKQLLQQPLDIERLRTAVRNRVLLSRGDVVFTPHNAFNSREALIRIPGCDTGQSRSVSRGAVCAPEGLKRFQIEI